MSFLQQMEAALKAHGEQGLDHIINYWGADLELYRPVVRDDAYSRVHNKNAGNPVEKIASFQGAIAGDDFFPTTAAEAGVFKKAWLFCHPMDLRPGDEIRIVREDGRRMAYRVEQNPSIGQTMQIFTKWELAGIM